MLLHLKYSVEKVNFLHYYSEVYIISCHKSMVGKNSDYVHINVHKQPWYMRKHT